MSIDNLPAIKRQFAAKLLTACNRIAEASESGRRGAQKSAITIAARELGISETSLYRHYNNYVKSGKNPESLIDRRFAEQGTRSRVTSAAFVAFWQGLCIKYQRNGAIPSAYRELLKIWRTKSQVIPAYEDWDGWPKLPKGWSLKNLQRHAPSKLENTLLKQGIKTAAPMLAQVLATRAGCWPGSHFLFDDVWLDCIVNDGDRTGRPLQFGVLDRYTGKRICWGQKVRFKDPVTGKAEHLTEKDMRCIVAMWGATIGYSPRGTTLVVENATASISKELEELLYSASGGLIKVSRSGITGKNQALKNGYDGRTGGNPRHKAELESFHNLLHNALADFLAQTGHNRTEPETLHGLMKLETKLQSAIKSNPDIADLAIHHTMTMRKLVDALSIRVADINNRTNHNLEGWSRCGFEAEEMRTAPNAAWQPSREILPEIAQMLITTAANTGMQLVRRRKMSPNEAWAYSTAIPGNELIKLPAWCICDILGRDMARPVKVKSSYIIMENADLATEKIWYESRIISRTGNLQELPFGKYLAFANPYDAQQLFICDPQGKCLGIAPLAKRVSAADPHAVEQQMGKRAARQQQQMEYTRMIGADREAEIARKIIHNERLIKGEPVTALDYAKQALSMASPQDKREMTKLAKEAQIDIWAAEPEAEESSDFGEGDAPRISIF